VILFCHYSGRGSLPSRQNFRIDLVELWIAAPLVPVMIAPMAARLIAYWEMIMLYKRMLAAVMVSVSVAKRQWW
jgi:hypothetical protein